MNNYFRKKVNEKIQVFDYVKKLKLKYRISGDDIFICSPFYEDRTPSCSVSTTKGVFYCFGTQTRGDLVYLFSRIEGVSVDRFITEKVVEYRIEYPKTLGWFEDDDSLPVINLDRDNDRKRIFKLREDYNFVCCVLRLMRSWYSKSPIVSDVGSFYYYIDGLSEWLVDELRFAEKEFKIKYVQNP